jgi:hypothetical protein
VDEARGLLCTPFPRPSAAPEGGLLTFMIVSIVGVLLFLAQKHYVDQKSIEIKRILIRNP